MHTGYWRRSLFSELIKSLRVELQALESRYRKQGRSAAMNISMSRSDSWQISMLHFTILSTSAHPLFQEVPLFVAEPLPHAHDVLGP